MPPSLLWRRKTSTPFFPGAWPDASVPGHSDVDSGLPTHFQDAPPQLPELLHIRPDGMELDLEQGWSFPVALEKLSFEDSNGAQHSSQRVATPMASPQLARVPLSTSVSQDSYLTAADSEGLLTPELNRVPWLPSPEDDAQYANKSDSFMDSMYTQTLMQNTFNGSSISRHDTSIETIPVRTTTSAANDANDRSLRISINPTDPPLLNFAPPLSRSTLSLDFADLSYPSGSNDLPAPALPYSPSDSTPASFFIPSPSTGNAMPTFQSPVGIATTFYPVPNEDRTISTDGDPDQSLYTASSSPSSYSLADSPVLPSEDIADRGISETPQPYSLTATELDAFASAAAAATSVASSSLSFPTSLRSAPTSAEQSAADSDGYPLDEWREPLPHSRAYTNESGTPSLALAVAACASTTTELGRERVLAGDDHTADTDEELEREYERDVRIMRARRMSAPVPPSGADLSGDSPVSVQHTISSRVDVEPVQPVGVRAGISPGRGRPVTLPVLGRLRQFGGRIIGLLSGRRGGMKATQPDSRSGEGDFEVKRTTAVTNIEYESKYPIPAPQTPLRKARASHRSLPLPKALSMSPTASPKTPRAPRRDSFLPIESEQASRRMPRPFHARARSGVPGSGDKHREQRGIGADDEGTRAHVVRARTLTAPPAHLQAASHPINGQPERKARRFSLSSALSRSKLDALKTTVFPHPPLPDIPPSYKAEHGAHEGDDNESWYQPVRPVSMISGIGLDASQSEVNLGPSHQIEHRGNKRNSVRKSGKPTGVLPGGGYHARGTPSGQPLSCPPGAQLDTNKPEDQKKRRREARATSMLVGKEEVARNGLIAQDGPQSRPSQQYSVVERATVPRKSDDTSIIKSDIQENVAAVDNNNKLGRFSFSSTLSRRAMRAKSMIVSVGRRSNDLDYASPSDPTTPPRRTRGSTFSTVIDAGVRFDMLAPVFGPNGPSSPQTIRPEQISSETRQLDVITTTQDHESSFSPDSANFSETEEIHVAESESELDSMSFARTATLQDSLGSIFTREFDMYPSRPASVAGEDSAENVPVNFSQETERGPGALAEPLEGGAPLTKRVQLSPDVSAGMGSTRSSIVSDEDLREREEMEEERGFLRALGLEFENVEQGATSS